jgi:hypothetical protein
MDGSVFGVQAQHGIQIRQPAAGMRPGTAEPRRNMRRPAFDDRVEIGSRAGHILLLGAKMDVMRRAPGLDRPRAIERGRKGRPDRGV